MRAFRRTVLAAGLVTSLGGAACTGVDAFCADDFCGDAGDETGVKQKDSATDAKPDVRHDASKDSTTDAPEAKPDGGTKDAPDDVHQRDGRVDGGKDVEVDSFTCDPAKAPKDEPCVISDTYGIFVAPAASGGSDTVGQGTGASPYATLGKGIMAAKAAGKRVYACAATYAEQVVVNAAVDGVQVYGGLACPASGDAGTDGGGAAWTYSGELALVEPAVVGYALDVESLATGAHFEDVGFAPQVAPTAPGASSIAVMVNASVGVSFTRVSATALAGAAGATPGVTATNWCDPAAGPQAGAGTSGVAGGVNGLCTCAVAMAGGMPQSSTGGPGGAATEAASLAGSSNPDVSGAVAPDDGLGGDGTLTTGSGGKCSEGDQGANGAATSGGSSGGTGSLNASGWAAATAGAGGPGNPGQGGGGGGGAAVKGGTGGGAGGCGGNGGSGGGGGGASLAFAIVSSAVTLSSVTLNTAMGGTGGMGGTGELGQTGGGNGIPSAGQCAGNVGGDGAGGGGGGGGSGGPSVGIGWTGDTAPVVDGKTVASATPTPALTSPSGFSGGPGGDPGTGGLAGPIAQTGNGDNAGDQGATGVVGVAGAVARF